MKNLIIVRDSGFSFPFKMYLVTYPTSYYRWSQLRSNAACFDKVQADTIIVESGRYDHPQKLSVEKING